MCVLDQSSGWLGTSSLYCVVSRGSGLTQYVSVSVCGRYVDIVSMLTYYTHQSTHSHVVRTLTGLNRVWFALIALPFVIYPLCLLLASCFSNRGPVMSVGLLLMIGFRTFHPHRINDVSR